MTLETFNGVLERIEDDVAYITLHAPTGETFWGECPAVELTSKGIRERRRFLCKVDTANEGTVIEFIAIPDRQVSAEQEREIVEEIDRWLT